MSIFSKLRKKQPPKEITQKVGEEVAKIMKQYDCHIEIGHIINIFPNEVDKEK